MFGHSSKCQICGSIDLQVILKYGHQCPVHGHRTKDQLNDGSSDNCLIESIGINKKENITYQNSWDTSKSHT